MRPFITIMTALVLICVGFSLPLSAAGDAAAGKDLYTKKCKVCHAEDGAGTPAMQKKYGEKLLPLGGAKLQAMKDPDLVKEFKAATSHKALLKSVSDAEIDNVVAHIRTMKK